MLYDFLKNYHQDSCDELFVRYGYAQLLRDDPEIFAQSMVDNLRKIGMMGFLVIIIFSITMTGMRGLLLIIFYSKKVRFSKLLLMTLSMLMAMFIIQWLMERGQNLTATSILI